ncbi:MAG: hypothetical protein HKN32_02870 [Flavobacteriales bacterium]|nr:hypothetical protein [Flavobacteriales bacterium]
MESRNWDLQIDNPSANWKLSDYQEYIEHQHPRPVSFGWTTQAYIPPTEVFALLRQFYGPPSAQTYYPHGEFAHFGGRNSIPDRGRLVRSFPENSEEWDPGSVLERDGVYRVANDVEYCFGTQLELEEVIAHRNDRLYFSLSGNWSPNSRAQLVVELTRDGDVLYWKSQQLSEFIPDESGLAQAHLACPIYGAVKRPDDVQMKVYLWNKQRESLSIMRAWVWSDYGNPLIYSWDHPLNDAAIEIINEQ